MTLALFGCGKDTEGTTEGATEGATESATESATEGTSEAPKGEGDAVVLTSEHYTVTAAQMQFFFSKVYDDFASQYGDMINYMIDPKKSLREQSCPVDQTGKMTWFDYFADGALTSVKSYVVMAESAIKEGFTLTDADRELIEGQLADIVTAAKDKKYSSVEDYIRDYYGSMATVESLKSCFELFILANNYHQHLYGGYTFTDADYKAYANNNPEQCYKADFMYFRMSADIKEEVSDEVKAQKWAELKAEAIAFNNAVKDKDSFLAQVENYMRSRCTIVEDESKVDYGNMVYTEKLLSEAVNSAYTKDISYAKGTPNVDWIFKEGRLSGEQTVIENEEGYSCEIIFMLKPKYLPDEPTVDVRHILFNVDDKEGSDEKAKAKAEQLYESWKKGDATEDSFAKLAMENTEDTGSAASGGLYEAVVPGQMVTEFNDWCFDSARKAGDTDIVKTDYGYHVMYFVKKGMCRWKGVADKGLREAGMASALELAKKEVSITVKDAKLDSLP